MQLFELLANLLQGLFAWLPRPYLVNVTERAVLFRRGQEPILKNPGFRWHTPLFSDYELFSILKDATEFEPVVLPTRDSRALAVGFVIGDDSANRRQDLIHCWLWSLLGTTH